MIKNLRLINFKNFKDAELGLGPFSLLIGTNAAGKINLRDAFRFLHGIARGYTLAEILGERYAEGGVLQWRGIRGGAREITYSNTDTFRLEVSFSQPENKKESLAFYSIEVQPFGPGGTPILVSESLSQAGKNVFRVYKEESGSGGLWAEFGVPQKGKPSITMPISDDKKPFLSSAANLYGLNRSAFDSYLKDRNVEKVNEIAYQTVRTLTSMRFYDLVPEAMRVPSTPGQTVLGDRGENLSTALQAICENPDRKRDLIEWVKALTPMDAVDFEFPIYADGKTLVTLIESNGTKITANSASDGTLRFLGMLAIMFGPSNERFFFIEELENGIHPTRLHLMVDLIENQMRQSDLQIIATTHSPQLLRLVNRENLLNSSLIYRLEDELDGHIKQIAELPANVLDVLKNQDAARLFESGWFENTMRFLPDEQKRG